MSAYPFIGVQTEDRLWGELESRRRALAASVATVTATQAAIATGLAQSYPWLDTGIVQSLTQAGLPANSAQARSVALLAATTTAQDGGFEDPAPAVPDSWFNALWETADVVKNVALQGARAAMMVGGFLFEEVGEAVIPSAYQASLESDKPIPMATTDPITGISELDALIKVPHNAVSAISQFANPDFWSKFWTNYTNKAAPSTLRLAIGDIASGVGPAFFSLDEAREGAGIVGNYERRQELRARLQMPGGNGTPETASTLGRILAMDVYEPDSWSYKILSGAYDFGANVVTPVDLGLGEVAKGAGLISNAQRIARGGQVGLLGGVVKRVDMETAVDQFLTGPVGVKWVDALTETKDTGKVWDMIGRVDPRLANEIAATTDRNAVMGTLRHTLGTQIREVPTAGVMGRTLGSMLGEYGSLYGPGAGVLRSLRNVRAIHEVPKGGLNPHSVAESAKTVHDYIRNAKMGDEMVDKYLSRLAGMENGDSNAFLNLSIDLGVDLADHLLEREAGILGSKFGKSQIRDMTKIFQESIDDWRLYFIDEVGNNMDVLGSKTVMINGKESTSPSVHLLSELINDVVPLPGNARDIKRATSFMGRVWDIPGVKGSTEMADYFLGNIWKPFQLVTRFAYPVRVIGEEQVRLAATGFDSLFAHPWSYLQWAMSRKGGKDLEGALFNTGPEGKFGNRLDLIQEMTDFRSAMARGSAGWAGMPGDMLSGKYNRVTRNDGDKFYAGAGTELQLMVADPVMQRVAGGLGKGDLDSIGRSDVITKQKAAVLKEATDASGTLPATTKVPPFQKVRDLELIKEWFFNGGGRTFREELGRVKGKEVLSGDSAAARQAADQYIDTYLYRLNIKTGQNPDLINAVATGKLGDIDLLKYYNSKDLTEAMKEYDDVLPHMVKWAEVSPQARGQLDRGVATLFTHLMTRPTNYLSRSPFFRQAYYDEIERLMGFATSKVQAQTITRIRKFGGFGEEELLTRGGYTQTEVRLARIMQAGEGTKIQSYQEIDTLAKAFALQATREKLYDLTKRNQFFDAFRHVFPFGDAWKEIMTAWFGILKERPSNLRRFQQGIQGALGPDFGEMSSEAFGTGQLPGQGFIYTDPQTQQLMFNYPGSELFSGLLLGTLGQGQPTAQVNLTGQVSGLNLFSATVLPGIGPSIQYPMAALGDITGVELPKGLHDIVYPYGEPDLEQGFLEENIYPAWLQKLTTALFADPETHRLYANTVTDVMRALVRTGKYKNDTPEAQNELLEAATARARALFMVRAIAQSTVPTGPSVSWSQADIQGNLVPITIIANDYRALVDHFDGDSDKALTEWLRIYGTESLLALQGKTRQIYYRPLKEESYGWIRENPDLERDYEMTIGFFAPDPNPNTDGPFDYANYLRTINEETTQVLRPKEQLRLSNDFLGTMAYENAKTQVHGRGDPAAELWLAEVKEMLRQKYPGFDDQLPIKSPPKTSELIEDLTKGSLDPRLYDTNAAKAIRIYDEARAQAQQIVDANSKRLSGSTTYESSKSTQFLREWLRSVATNLMADYPEFREAWQRVYRHEIVQDKEPAE